MKEIAKSILITAAIVFSFSVQASGANELTSITYELANNVGSLGDKVIKNKKILCSKLTLHSLSSLSLASAYLLKKDYSMAKTHTEYARYMLELTKDKSADCADYHKPIIGYINQLSSIEKGINRLMALS